MTWRQTHKGTGGTSGNVYVNEYGWTFCEGILGSFLEPCPEAFAWFRATYERRMDSETKSWMPVDGRSEANAVVNAWVDHCVTEWMEGERERLEALKALDEVSGNKKG